MADRYDIHIDQGANFRMYLDYRNPDNTAVNVNGYTFKMSIKSAVGGATLLNANSFVTVENAPLGRILVNIPAASTTNLNFVSGVYDIFTTSPAGIVTRLVWGDAFLHRAIST